MAVLVADCPRCGSDKITFDVLGGTYMGMRHGWQRIYELYSVCRHCESSTIFLVNQKEPGVEEITRGMQQILSFKGSLNNVFDVVRYISLRDVSNETPPEHLPDEIRNAFNEGATCMAVQCWNAAGAMFRLCVDLATKPLLPLEEADGLTTKVRRDLGLRLPWLIKTGFLPAGLGDLSSSIREDGNDGAHVGSLTRDDAEDILDFTRALLERLYTEPERLKVAQQRRKDRREKQR